MNYNFIKTNFHSRLIVGYNKRNNISKVIISSISYLMLYIVYSLKSYTKSYTLISFVKESSVKFSCKEIKD